MQLIQEQVNFTQMTPMLEDRTLDSLRKNIIALLIQKRKNNNLQILQLFSINKVCPLIGK